MTEEPILIITTGGTIDKQYFDALSKYQVVETVFPKLLCAARVKFPFLVEQFARKDSLDLTDGDRARLAERIRSAKSSRIVVTHGTDTMTKTAQSLQGIYGKTIVLVGA